MRTFLAIFLILISGLSHATDVSGTISTPTVWTQALSPYIVTGNINVISTLRIESNVQVRFSANTGLTVGVGGQLLANGQQNARVVFTSVRDVVGGNPGAQPGDWNHLRIAQMSAYGEVSVLNYVHVRYGKGLEIVSSSPRIANSVFDNNQIAAIVMDRSSSPSGTGLSGSGNGVNGILVPAGEITSYVEWRLKGLPYVVNDGVLHVGAKPPPLTFAPEFYGISPNAAGQVQVNLADPAPSPTLISFSRDNAAALALPADVTIATGAYSAAVAIQALASGTANLTAASALGSAAIQITVAPRPTLRLDAVTVANARVVQGVVRLQSSSNTGGLTVSLSSADPAIATVPANVLIPSGITGANFPVTGVAVGTTSITASAPGFDPSTVAVTTRPLTMNLPQVITAPIGIRNARLIFSDPIPPGGTSFALASSDTGVFTVAATILAPAGAHEINLPLTGLAEGNASIQVTHPDYGSASSNVVVAKIQLSWAPLNASIPKGLSNSFELRLSQGAPVGGLSVALLSNDPATASVAVTSIAVAPSQLTAIARVRVTGVNEGSATITASAANTLNAELPVTVSEPAQFVFVPINYQVGVGLRAVNARLEVRSAGQNFVPEPPLTISLTSSDPAKLTVSPQIITGSSFASNFVMTGVAPSTTPVSITASAAGISSAGAMAVDVIAPTLEFVGLDGIRGINSPRDDFYLRWRVPQSSEPEQRPAVTQTIALAVTDAVPGNIVDGVFETASGGQLSGTVQITPSSAISPQRFVGVPTALGSYKISAVVPGVGTYLSANQEVAGLSLRFNRSSYVVGKGMAVVQVLTVERMNGGTPVATSTQLPVTVTSSDPSRVATFSVTIPAFASQAFITLSGVELTNNVAINANALNYTDAVPMIIRVVDPQLEFYSFPNVLTPVSPRKQFCFLFKVPESETVNQYPFLSANLALVNAVPSNIISGFYNAYSGGVPISAIQTSYPGQIFCPYLDAPSVVGSFAIEVSIPGNTHSPWLSPVQTVEANTIRFKDASISVSKGLRLNPIIETPEVPTISNEIALSCTAASLCQIPSTIEMPAFSNSQVMFPLLGLNLGVGQLNASSTPADLGNVSVPFSVVPLTAYFNDYGPGGSGKSPSGWALDFTSPGVANTQLTADLELIDVVPAGAATLYQSAVDIEEGNNSSSPDGYNGFNVDYLDFGTFKLRATIPGLGSWTSGDIATASINANICSFQVGVGLESSYLLRTSLSSPTPINIASSCTSPQVCSTTSPTVLLPGASEAAFLVQGLALGQSIVAINAPPFPVTTAEVNVVSPQVNIYGPGGVNVNADADFNVDLKNLSFGCYTAPTALSAITMSVVSSDPSKLMVPATLVIPAGASGVILRVRGLAPGAVNLTVNWPGLLFPETRTVQVVP